MLLKDRIKGFDIFAGLCPDELEEIIPLCQICNFNADEIIVEEDAIGSALYIILEGRLEVKMRTPQPQMPENADKLIATRKAGDIFGVMSFMKKDRTVARLTAIEKVVVIKIDGDKLNKLFENNNHLGYLIMRNIALILDQRLIDLFFKLRNG